MYFASTTSDEPVVVIGPPPKSVVPVNDPATTICPAPSMAVAFAASVPAPPIRFAHGAPVGPHAGVIALAAALGADWLFALSTAVTVYE